MIRLRLAGKSLLNRRATVLLTVLSLTIGIMLVLGITHLRTQVKESFNNTLSGTDLIVGARGGTLNLLLYSVFHMGGSTHTVRWQTYEELAKHSQVKWAVPLAMGDSHKGHRVVATTPDFFARYAYGKKQPLQFAHGKAFAGKYDVVIGAAVARKLQYQLGDKIVLAHGIAEVSLAKHDESPFVVTGILAPTGTPVDKSLYISLAGMAAIHEDWQSGVKIPAAKKQSPITQHAHDDHEHEHSYADGEKHRGHNHGHEQESEHEHEHEHEYENEHEHEAHDHHAHDQSLSAIFVGLQSRAATFTVQRQINQYTGEPLQAIVPGLALAELWQLVGSVEVAFNVIAWLVVLASLLGMVASILTALNERQREFAILRSLGAHPLYIVSLVIGEVFLLAASAIALAIILLVLLINALQPWLLGVWGLSISADILGRQQLEYIAVFFAVALAMAIIPAVIAYRRSLNDGLSVRQ